MSNSIVPFQFDTHEIRVIVIDGEPWFVGKDVCDVLELSLNTSQAYARLKDYEKLTYTLYTSGQNRDYTCISESGLFRLVLTSRKPQAEPFQDWVIEVLKQIRKTGSYSIHSQPQTTQPQLPSRQLALETAKAVAEIQNLISDNNPRLAQFLIDHAISDLMPASNSLTGSKLKGVVEIAESLGLPVNGNNRTSLGKFVKKSCNHLSQQEERLVNGQQRFVACYPEDNPEVIDAVRAFFS